MPNLYAHPLIKQSHDVSQAIEACGASPALTAAVCKSAELTDAIGRLVDEQCINVELLPPGALDGLQPHEQRVVLEKAQLDAGFNKLGTFLDSVTYRALDDEDKILLLNQHGAMGLLSRILGQRIERFKRAATDNDFPLGKACDMSGEGGCEACQ